MENYNAREGKPQPLRISPRAYALAVQYDVNLYQVKPTGPEGRIIERDIRAAIGIIIEDDEPAAVSAPAEDASIEEAPVEDAPTEDTPAEDAPAEDASIEEAPVEDAPAEETPVEDAPAEETPVEDAPAEETPVEDAPAEETPAEDAPTEDTPAEDAPAEDASIEEAPVEDAPAEETPVEDAPAEDAPTEDTPAEDAPTEDTPAEEAPTEDTPVEEAPTEETPMEETAIVAAPVVSISKTEEDETEEDTPKAETNKLYGYTDVIIPRTPHDSLEFKTLTLGVSFDATAIMNLRASIKENGKHMGTENITINDMILFATAKVLRKFKALNAHFLEDRIRYFDNVHLGIAVDTPEGLKKPTVFDANKLSLSALSKLTKLIIADAEENGSEAEKWEGASFTVSNLGSHGIESFTPVLMAPQTGVLGVCASAKRIKEENGEAVFYSAIPLSLTFDTRALDRTSAAKFLRELVFALENFELLLLK